MSSKRAMRQAQKQAYAKHRSNITNNRFEFKKKILIKNKDIISKCNWTPYHDMVLKGGPSATIINGEIKMHNNKIIGLPNGKMVNFD